MQIAISAITQANALSASMATMSMLASLAPLSLVAMWLAASSAQTQTAVFASAAISTSPSQVTARPALPQVHALMGKCSMVRLVLAQWAPTMPQLHVLAVQTIAFPAPTSTVRLVTQGFSIQEVSAKDASVTA